MMLPVALEDRLFEAEDGVVVGRHHEGAGVGPLVEPAQDIFGIESRQNLAKAAEKNAAHGEREAAAMK